MDPIGLEFRQKADPEELNLLDKIGKGLVMLYNTVKAIKVDLPKVYPVKGSVDIDSLPPVSIDNLTELGSYFAGLEKRIGDLAQAISMAKASKIEIPKMEFPKMDMPKLDTKPLLDALHELKEEIGSVSGKEVRFPKRIEVSNFPVQMTPQPVTNISINPLRGIVKSTPISVTTSATALPSSAVENRRSVLIYNNGAENLYLGGSDVTVANGLPVAAASYSPIIDAGIRMTVYGIVNSGPIDVRVMEISNDATGG